MAAMDHHHQKLLLGLAKCLSCNNYECEKRVCRLEEKAKGSNYKWPLVMTCPRCKAKTVCCPFCDYSGKWETGEDQRHPKRVTIAHNIEHKHVPRKHLDKVQELDAIRAASDDGARIARQIRAESSSGRVEDYDDYANNGGAVDDSDVLVEEDTEDEMSRLARDANNRSSSDIATPNAAWLLFKKIFQDNPAASAFYFQNWHELHARKAPDGGIRGLVYRIKRQDKIEGCQPGHEIEERDLTMTILLLSELLICAPEGTKRVAMGFTAGLFGMIYKHVSDGLKEGTVLPWFPSDYAGAKSFIFGKNRGSLWMGLPSVKTELLKAYPEGAPQDHAVVHTLDEVINHIMARGAELWFLQGDDGTDFTMQGGRGIRTSKAAQALLKKNRSQVKKNPEKMAFGHLIFWSDAFIVSWVKQKDNAVW